MTVETFVDPSREAFDIFKSLPRDRPINMLNLLQFHDVAQYPQGHEHAGKGWSGTQAYAEYGKTTAPIFARVGGSIIWRGKMEITLIGPNDILWDSSFIARYPNSGAFLEMVTDPAYQLAVVNRQAAVRTSRLVRFDPLPIAGSGFD